MSFNALGIFIAGLFTHSAFAQEAQKAMAAAATPGQPSILASLVPFVLIFAVFYFLMILPQKKRVQEEQAMIASLGKGDEVFTKSGLIGTISGMTDKIVTLEVASGVKVKVLRGQVGGPLSKLLEKGEGQLPSGK